MARFYLTFGQKYARETHPHWSAAHPDGWVTIEAETAPKARLRAMVLFGPQWADLYDEADFDRTLFPAGELAHLGPDDELPFVFDRRVLSTIRELLDGACQAQRDGKASEFLTAYRAFTEHADVNLGYIIGYLEPHERRREMYAAFDLVHPIAGGVV